MLRSREAEAEERVGRRQRRSEHCTAQLGGRNGGQVRRSGSVLFHRTSRLTLAFPAKKSKMRSMRSETTKSRAITLRMIMRNWKWKMQVNLTRVKLKLEKVLKIKR